MELAYEDKLVNGEDVLVVPAEELKLENKEVTFHRAVVFKRKGGEIVYCRIVEIFGKTGKFKDNKKNLFKKFNQKNIPDFTGSVIIYNKDYQFISGYAFSDGRRERGMSWIEKGKNSQRGDLTSGRVLSTLKTQTETQECYDWYLVTTYSDGSQNWTFLYHECTPSDFTTNTGNPGPTGPHGITNNLTNPCFKDILEVLKHNHLQNDVNTIITDFNQSPPNTLIISEVNNPNMSLDGYTQGSNIYLNYTAMANSSREYVAATIIHEIMHANIPSTQLQDEHVVMASYVTPMKEALMEAYPSLGENNAYALSWGGLYEYGVWNVLSASYRSQIQAINNNFKLHGNDYGTSCH